MDNNNHIAPNVNPEIEVLLGKTLTSVEVNSDSAELIFTTDCGRKFKLYHKQNCCERVWLADVAGDLSDLIGTPILIAEERTSDIIVGPWDRSEYLREDTETWTFYKLATIRGYVTLRWYGTSNGCYSERVDFVELTKKHGENCEAQQMGYGDREYWDYVEASLREHDGD